MAWEDLEQDIAEEFGDQRTEVHAGFLFHSSTDREKRSAVGYARWKMARRVRRRIKRRREWAERHLLTLATGSRPSRCQRPGCHNLLSPKRGPIRRTCSAVCRTTLYRNAGTAGASVGGGATGAHE